MELQELINQSRRIVFFGGAGVSTESGIPDFRSQDGLYHQHYAYPPEQILSHSFFMQRPEEFYRFYRDKMLPLEAQPNRAHLKLAEMEEKGRLKAIVTQNIDGLHQKAGSRRVYELHGSVHRNYCMKCHQFYPPEAIRDSSGVPKCTCGGIIKPDVVLYEEGLDEDVLTGSVKAISRAPGIGKRTAERVILDLKDKVGTPVPAAGVPEGNAGSDTAAALTGGAAEEAVEALTALGYQRSEAAAAVRKCADAGSTEEILRQALKYL